MATFQNYLVPVDFSKTSERALKHAVNLAKEKKTKLLLVHVLPAMAVYPEEEAFVNYHVILRKDAEEQLKKIERRNGLPAGRYSHLILVGQDIAAAIAAQAKKSRASMIVMGSHGRTGLSRLVLGSTAERTLRYAHCPVLIVK
jgi:nucleotide-binding universal stress UspA family protein